MLLFKAKIEVSMVKKFAAFFLVIIPLVLFLGFKFHGSLTGRDGKSTNIFHDAIGGSILGELEIEFEKILIVENDKVIFCDQEQRVYSLNRDTNKVTLKEQRSERCDPNLSSNGLGKFFAELEKESKKRDQKTE